MDRYASSISMTLTEPCFLPDRPPHNYPNPTFSLIVASSFDKHVIIRRADMRRVCGEARKTRSHIRANWRRQLSSGWRSDIVILLYANLTVVSNWDQTNERIFIILNEDILWKLIITYYKFILTKCYYLKVKIDKNYSYIKIQKCFYKKKDVQQIDRNFY